ncbi:MAG: CpaF family protein [Candidatus Aenigmarchaeota archaeon]|nr:CpaF family protein [Candidatus Aenigmarchaeota archaeon]
MPDNVYNENGNYIYRLKHSGTAIDSFLSLLYDDQLEEVMYIGERKTVKIFHRKYGMCDTDFTMKKVEANKIIEQILKSAQDINASGNIINTSLADGSRVNIVRGEIVDGGPIITIRKFKKDSITIIDLLRSKTINIHFAAYMWMCIEGLNLNPANIIFCGGTSSGKTTILNAFTVFIPKISRIITIEDCFELRLPHPHIVSLESTNNVPMQSLVKTTLRMRPNRIIIGEVRDKEAQDLFTAMNIGFNGCMGTLHSNSSRETISRITNKPMEVPVILLRNLDLIVMQKKKIIDGKTTRYISEVSEISGSEGDNPLLNTVFSFNETTNILERTNVPSRTRAKIVSQSGISIMRFEQILDARKRILSMLTERGDSYKNTELLDVIDQQSKITREQIATDTNTSNNTTTNNYSPYEKKEEEKKEDKGVFSKIGSFFEEKMF